MTKSIHVNIEKCVGCRTCEMVCSLGHEKEIDPFHSRIKVIKWEQAVRSVPMNCRQCKEAPCEMICPSNAITYNDELGSIKIRYERCIGCRSCISVCPFGAMGFNDHVKRVFKCDLCNGDPLCVQFCAYDALEFVDNEVT